MPGELPECRPGLGGIGTVAERVVERGCGSRAELGRSEGEGWPSGVGEPDVPYVCRAQREGVRNGRGLEAARGGEAAASTADGGEHGRESMVGDQRLREVLDRHPTWRPRERWWRTTAPRPAPRRTPTAPETSSAHSPRRTGTP